MEISREEKNGAVIFHLNGNLALTGVKVAKTDIKPAVEDVAITKIIIDMKNVNLMDSSGIGFLVASAKTILKRGGKFALCDCQRIVAEIITSTHLDDFLQIFPSMDDAVSQI
ncbi:MAG: STAS domain-containing protein [SAR324 cluster bacterium]|nr:STAS domain-containing protein [SAR324 cluster bacterium]